MINFLQAATGAATTAAATTDAAAPKPGFFAQNPMLWMIIIFIVVIWLFMWRPESKRRKQQAAFRNGLKKGDKVITAGGIYGTIKEVQGASLLIEVDSNVTLRVDKNMVVADNSDLQQPAK